MMHRNHEDMITMRPYPIMLAVPKWRLFMNYSISPLLTQDYVGLSVFGTHQAMDGTMDNIGGMEGTWNVEDRHLCIDPKTGERVCSSS